MIADVEIIRSNAHRTYLELRDRIIQCVIEPSQKIKIADLASELKVSPGAVREALSRLTTEHLVEARDQRGFRAAPISLADLDDLTETRIEIETLALRKAIALGDENWRLDVRNSHDAMASFPGSPHSPGGAELHARFHNALVAGCGSPSLLRIRASLYEISQRYRYFASQRSRPGRQVDDEHKALAEAVIARDADRAADAIAMHIRTTAEMVKASIAP